MYSKNYHDYYSFATVFIKMISFLSELLQNNKNLNKSWSQVYNIDNATINEHQKNTISNTKSEF